MNPSTLTQLETRLQTVERQNRALIALLCVCGGLALLGAARPSPPGQNVLSVDELRTHRLSLTDDTGKVVHSWAVHGGWVIEH